MENDLGEEYSSNVMQLLRKLFNLPYIKKTASTSATSILSEMINKRLYKRETLFRFCTDKSEEDVCHWIAFHREKL